MLQHTCIALGLVGSLAFAVTMNVSGSSTQLADITVPGHATPAVTQPVYNEQEMFQRYKNKAHYVAPAPLPTVHPTRTSSTHPITTIYTATPTPTPTPTPTSTPTPTTAQPAPTYTTTTTEAKPTSGSIGERLLAEAETQQGVPYVYGGDTPGGFDCSGLIYWAALRIGIASMPRDTFEMLNQGVSSGLLVQTGDPQPGDLAFFGSGHVELYVSPGNFFGAQQTGTLIGFHDYGTGYVPTAYYYVS